MIALYYTGHKEELNKGKIFHISGKTQYCQDVIFFPI